MLIAKKRKILASLSGAMSYSDMVISDGAIAYWRLNEPSGTVAADSVGARHGTINGTAFYGESGAVSNDTAMRFAYDFGSHVVLPSLSLVLPFSFEVWVKKSAQGPGETVIFLTTRNASVPTNPMFALFEGRVQFGNNSVGLIMSPVGPRYDDNNWHYLVGIATATGLQLYVDGALVQTGAFVLPLAANTGYLAKDDFVGVSNISLDEVAIYPTALTPTQINAHYTAR